MKVFGKQISTLRNYLAVGLTAFAVEYTSFAVLYSMFGVEPGFAQPASFLMGLCVSFVGNRFITFSPGNDEMHARKPMVQVILFLALGLFNLVVSTMLLLVFIDNLGLHPLLAKLIIMGAIITWNFVLLGKLIFRTKKSV